MQQFLSFWNAYNVTIIEVLIAIIVLTVAFLVYSLVFGKKDESLDSAQIEKTLQKILEAQGGKPAGAAAPAAATDHGHSAAPDSAAGVTASAGSSDELTRIRAALQEKEAQLEQMKASVAEATAAATTGAAAGAGATAAVDTSALEARIKELEGNLAEYEIISEDIADLSRYKEENARLLKQLDAQKAAPAVAAAPSPAAAVAEPVAEAVAVAAPAPTPAAQAVSAEPAVEAVAPAPVPGVAVDAIPVEAAAAVAAEPAPEAPSVIDDELMKEFAAAVEGQKNPAVSNETDKLMNDFENFMKKG